MGVPRNLHRPSPSKPAILRPLLALLTTTLAFAAPAAAATSAPPCHRSSAHPRVVATRTIAKTGTAAIVACDRASGHRKTLRHGFAGDDGERLPSLGVPAVQGTKVLWSELAGSPRHLRQDLRSADVRHPTPLDRRRIGPRPGNGPLLRARGWPSWVQVKRLRLSRDA